MTDVPRFLSGTAAIAKQMGVSKRTVLRMIKEGRLPTFRTGDHTSPHRVERKDLEAVRRERRGA